MVGDGHARFLLFASAQSAAKKNIGAQRRSLTGEARGLSAGFIRKGKGGDQARLPGEIELAWNDGKVRDGTEDYFLPKGRQSHG
jgi:hypothetical protein